MSSLFSSLRRASRQGVAVPLPSSWVPAPDERTDTAVPAPAGPLPVETWEQKNTALVARMRTMRPGLTEPQAHAALEALRTLGIDLHETRPEKPPVCPATSTGYGGRALSCNLSPGHPDSWHEDPSGIRWKNSQAGHTSIHQAAR